MQVSEKLTKRKDLSFSFQTLSLSLSFFVLQSCQGIAAWRAYHFEDFQFDKDNATLKSVTYEKKRTDTILRVSFHSTLGQLLSAGCSNWFIRFDGHDCLQPAPISTLIFTWRENEPNSREWNIAPSELSGLCKTTAQGLIIPGNIDISVHVKQCENSTRSDSHSGRPASIGKATTLILVEEYCLN